MTETLISSHAIIIAEAGVNHNGDLDVARKMIAAAAEAGADMVKFQTFRADQVAIPSAEKAPYQRIPGESEPRQIELLKKLELSAEDHRALIRCCRDYGVRFLSTPFDFYSIDMLVELGLTTWKIPSGEITNLPYLRKIGALKQDVILSTGMADMNEVAAALDVLIHFGTSSEQVALLHCTTAYPVPFEDANLRCMATMAEAFPGVRVGYSDHTLGFEAAVAAVALGASVVEKHFTLDRSMDGPDHKASLEPDELRSMIVAIRHVELALGDGVKRCCPREAANASSARKSIVAATDIRKGDVFDERNLAVKRPGTGLSPMRWDELLGRKATRDYSKDDYIEC